MLDLIAALSLALIALARPIPRSSSIFHDLIVSTGKAVIVNSCDYNVYLLPVYPGGFPSPPVELIASRSNWSQDLQTFTAPKGSVLGGVSLKISQTNSFGNNEVTQFEYTVNSNINWYDMSLIDCGVKGTNSMNGTIGKPCPGQEGGLQAICGSGGGFRCSAGEHCEKEAYFVPEYDYKPNPPVGNCQKEMGIAFELCAAV